jgi:hypothetical protein
MLIPAQRQWFHHGFEHDVGVLLAIEKNPASCSIAPLKGRNPHADCQFNG